MNREFSVACSHYVLQRRNFALLYGERTESAQKPSLKEFLDVLRKANGPIPPNFGESKV